MFFMEDGAGLGTNLAGIRMGGKAGAKLSSPFSPTASIFMSMVMTLSISNSIHCQKPHYTFVHSLFFFAAANPTTPTQWPLTTGRSCSPSLCPILKVRPRLAQDEERGVQECSFLFSARLLILLAHDNSRVLDWTPLGLVHTQKLQRVFLEMPHGINDFCTQAAPTGHQQVPGQD